MLRKISYLLFAVPTVMLATAYLGFWIIRKVEAEFDHVADLGDTYDDWWNEIFDGYEWDDFYDPA
jgi:hypothetical protein